MSRLLNPVIVNDKGRVLVELTQLTPLDGADGHFEDRILNPNVEPDDDETKESHIGPFITAMFLSVAVIIISVIMTSLTQLQTLYTTFVKEFF